MGIKGDEKRKGETISPFSAFPFRTFKRGNALQVSCCFAECRTTFGGSFRNMSFQRFCGVSNLEKRRALEEERKQRILDDRTRGMGVDVATLDAQVCTLRSQGSCAEACIEQCISFMTHTSCP